MKPRPGFLYPVIVSVCAWVLAVYVAHQVGIIFYLPSSGFVVAVKPSTIAVLVFTWVALLCFLPRMPWVELNSPRPMRLRAFTEILFISVLILLVSPLGVMWSIWSAPRFKFRPSQLVFDKEFFSHGVGFQMFSGLQGIIILSLTMLTIALIGHKYGRLSLPVWVVLYWLGQSSGMLYWMPSGALHYFESTFMYGGIFSVSLWTVCVFTYVYTFRGIKPILTSV
ncbi:hypothetical protein BK816_07135 [Boudabousia tangfeifanii]|uniref:Uncharacterized protein n=1 Tax=Boudabousia tangfeifanii TaxID=1912795 RepID=A0A1D9MLS1_9ACTO|nr:hypothetical protein [Boudabousia tangfeifanii]AOZ73090.1 hypothetical protein BK816_07135 [Boudabousia tangfeifanii]